MDRGVQAVGTITGKGGHTEGYPVCGLKPIFSRSKKIIEASPAMQLSKVTYEKRGTHEGFISGELCFVDGSAFYFREFVDVETIPDRLMYAYQFIDSSQKLVFRYDNTGHHKKLGLSTYPHHKHDGVETSVIPSAAPDLATVLQEVESFIQFP